MAIKSGFNAFVNKYDGKLSNVLRYFYPEMVWYEWRFAGIVFLYSIVYSILDMTKYKWNAQNTLEFLDYVSKKYNIKSPQEWLNISTSQLIELNGACI